MNITQNTIDGLTFIKTEKDNFSITLSNLGASIYLIKYGEDILTLTPSLPKEFALANIYHGKTVGRTGNRIPGKVITIKRKKYILENNEGLNTLHGGKNGISSKFFTYSINEKSDNLAEVDFYYTSPDGESGYPGNLNLTVRYLIDFEEKSVAIAFTATTDKDTLCNLTNHIFFTLGEKDLTNISLKINASKYLSTSPVDLLPIAVKPVPPYLDFRKEKLIFEDIDTPILKDTRHHGYDHHFYFDDINLSASQVTLSSPRYELNLYTDFPGVQIYSDNWPKDIDFLGTDKKAHRGVAIEAQESFLKREILTPQDCYNHYIRFVFKKKD